MKPAPQSIVFYASVMAAVIALMNVALAAPTYVAPSQVTWQPGGPNLPPGSKMAVIAGDPSKPGFYTIRVSFPDGAVAAPAHWHKMAEYFTVLQGTFVIGIGDTVDKTNAKAMQVGSFITMPAGVHHWGMAKGATIIQVSGEGPVTWSTVKSSGM